MEKRTNSGLATYNLMSACWIPAGYFGYLGTLAYMDTKSKEKQPICKKCSRLIKRN